jgi:cytochrome P450
MGSPLLSTRGHRPTLVTTSPQTTCARRLSRLHSGRSSNDVLRSPLLRDKNGSESFNRRLDLHRALPVAVVQDVAAGSFNPLPVILFFTPGLLTLVYAFFKGKGNLSDGLSRLLTEVSQGYFQPSMGGENIPTAEGELSDLAGDEPLFKALYQWFMDSGGVFKLAFGPKAFIVISDPIVVKHLLKDNAFNYDKGVLAEILEPIMGKGLIPADLETWKTRRRQIVPAFHQAYLENCVRMFGECTKKTIERLENASSENAVIDMEQEFLNLGLDIIGIGVFNYDFGSINQQSPVIQAVYGVLKEAEHRSTFYIPYWNIPISKYVVPRQIQFNKDIKVINQCLDDLIERAKSSRRVDDIEALQSRDYSQVQDASLLRFLVDMRDADLEQKQLRDDLMTMLIAGHETTAAVLTWTIYLLATHPEIQEKVYTTELKQFASSDPITLADIGKVPYLRNIVAESLRLYPQPPILIRRALEDDVLPPGLNGDPNGYPIGKGADLFISVWNLHRSPHLWKDPDTFRPERFSEAYKNPDFKEWSGYDPEKQGSSLYANEVASDFAFLPFGGGVRKCVGDQFALMEATVCLMMTLSKYRFELSGRADDVGMATGATIHTANGLKCKVIAR